VVAGGINARPKEDSVVPVRSVPHGETDHVQTVALKFSSCSVSATILLLMMHLHDSVNSVGTVLLSIANANNSILMFDS